MRIPAAHPLLALAAGLLLFVAPPSRAGVEVGLAWVDEVDGVSSEAVMVSWLTDAEHPWEFMAGHIRGRSDARLSTPSVNFLAVSKRFTWRGWFAQGGVALTDSDTEVLSRYGQFMTGVGYRFNDRVALSLRHLSNANSGGRNRGENLLILQVGF